MPKTSFKFLDYPQSELVIGIVSPVGTDTKNVVQATTERLGRYGYSVEILKLSEYLKKVEDVGKIDESTQFKRIATLMDAGDALREKIKRGDALAFMAMSEIFHARPIDETSKEEKKPRKVRPKTAYILESLKHPDEVIALRRVYGDGFFLLSISSSAKTRKENLERRGMSETDAIFLINRDQNENRPSGLGQKTRDAFHLADAFIDANDIETGREQLLRSLDILFGDLYRTPSFDEYAMFLAFASAFRSGDLSRQVGAVVSTKEKEIVAVGCNDVPRYGGGLYSSDDEDEKRDHVLGIDSNVKERNEIFDDIVRLQREMFPDATKEISDHDLLSDVKIRLKGSTLSNITEFGRTVHAEMDAIISCARNGINIRGGTIYTTTFPCHNCARHIIAAGIETVVYVEPYPKSKAGELHEDSIKLEESNEAKVNFKPFVGIGSRRFMDLFSMGLSSGYPLERKVDETGKTLEWIPETGRLRVPMLPTTYIERERLSIEKLNELSEEKHDN